MLQKVALFSVALVLLSAGSNGPVEPARFLSGALVLQSPMTLGGGEVLLELDVDRTGRVTDVTTLRATPPFSEALGDAVRGWRFRPARCMELECENRTPIESRVLVAGMFRAPTTYDAPARGEVPEDVAPPSESIPFPTSLVAPPYPPTAHWYVGETVLVEVEVGEDGAVTKSRVLRSTDSLDEVSRAAAEQWRFRPARRNGKPVASVAYIVFGFREPVVSLKCPQVDHGMIAAVGL